MVTKTYFGGLRVPVYIFIYQARNDIIKATHPCSEDEAIQFAAMQCQVQLGDHNPQTHVPGTLEYVFCA